MKIYDTLFLPGWFTPSPPLPTHLPRLLLAKRYQPTYVRRCPVTQTMIPKLQLLDWEQLRVNSGYVRKVIIAREKRD